MNDVAHRVRTLVIGDLGLTSEVHLEDDLVVHGADELDMQGIAMHLEEEFGIQGIDEEKLFGESTIQKCIDLVVQSVSNGLAFV